MLQRTREGEEGNSRPVDLVARDGVGLGSLTSRPRVHTPKVVGQLRGRQSKRNNQLDVPFLVISAMSPPTPSASSVLTR